MNYRQVFFNKWIPVQFLMDPAIGHKEKVKGTGVTESGFKNKGLFHGWFTDTDGNTFALVECKEGIMYYTNPNDLKFTDTQNYLNE